MFLRHQQIPDLARGLVDLILGRNDEALAVLRTQFDSPEVGLIARELTARLMLKLGREAEAEAEFRVIRERGKMVPEPLLTIVDRAFAAYALGEYAESLDLSPGPLSRREATPAMSHSRSTARQCFATLRAVTSSRRWQRGPHCSPGSAARTTASSF